MSAGLRVGMLLSLAPWTLGEPAAAQQAPQHWVGSWATAPQTVSPDKQPRFANQTVRLVTHLSLGGQRIRLRISNLFGTAPLHLGSVHAALRTTEAEIASASDRHVSFAGKFDLVIPAGQVAVSDPVDLAVPALSDIAVSLYLPEEVAAATLHILAQQTGYVAAQPGDSTGTAAFAVGKTIDVWPFLAGIDVQAATDAFTIVALGDSIFDGDGSTPDANKRLPDAIAARLIQGGIPAGMVNEGLIGNRLLRGSPAGAQNPLGPALGESALARLDRDVLGQSNARIVLLRTGSNDLGLPGGFADMAELPTLAELERGYLDIAARSKAKGLTIIGMTLPPFENADFENYSSPQKEALRVALNHWILTGGAFDAVIDIDAVVRDPDHPSRLRPDYDSGDHLHPNDAGYAMIAQAVPLKLFSRAVR
jgi:lysophospholipase L1-like esterase